MGADDDDPATVRPIYLRGAIDVPAGVVRARAYASALGWYRLLVDGTDLTGPALVPRFTSFDHEIEYQAYDITEAVRPGTARIDLVVADGRFRGTLGMHNRRQVYGGRLGGLVQVLFELADGSRVWAGSDAGWLAATGPIVFADPKLGETIDLRIPSPLSADADRVPREPVTLLPAADRRLVAETTARLTQVDTLPATVTSLPDGSQLVDLGQNFAGVLRVRVAGPAGRTVTLQHSEEVLPDGTLEWEHLDPDGINDTSRPHRFQRDEIVLDGETTWVQPWFTYHGFRYVRITGLDRLTDADVQGVVLSSDPTPTGSFESSDERLNQLWRNTYWSLRSNFTDTPTDCPTRERGGFTGDAMLFAPAATVLSDVQTFFRRYLATLRLDQFADGTVPMIIPGEFSAFSGGPTADDIRNANAVGWGDATVLLPWTLYQRYADTAVLAAQYDSMRRWVEHLHRGGARAGFIWGEWVRPGEPTVTGLIRDMTINRKNIGLAYLAHSAGILGRIAGLLGHDEDARRYAEMAEQAVEEWRTVAIPRRGRVGVDRQDDYVRALAFDLLPEDHRGPAAQRLVELIEKAGDHLGTGFLSTPMLLSTLVRAGRTDVAYRLLLQTTAPSWLAMVEAGATTIHENWDERLPDGRRQGSSNHYTFGSVVEWFVSGIVGISPAEPGFRRVRIAPTPGGGLTHARASADTPFGPVTVGWRRADDDDTATVRVDIDLPLGVTGEFVHADGTTEFLPSGTHRLAL